MTLKEIHWRTLLFAAVFASMIWGFRLMLFEHAPLAFNGEMEDLSYGWYVPVFSLYVLWRERGEIVKSLGAPSAAALPLLGFALLAGFLGARGSQLRLEIVGFALTLLALVWTFYGRAAMRRTAFPILFLFFCMPLHSFLDAVTIHLRLFAVSTAYIIMKIFGVEVVRTGTMLADPAGAFAIDVAAPCSGLRSLFAMMALTAGYTYFNQPTWTRRAIHFALSIPIAIVGNVVRIFSIVLVAAWCSPDFATGFYHDYSGYIVFAVAIALMVATSGLITAIAERRGEAAK